MKKIPTSLVLQICLNNDKGVCCTLEVQRNCSLYDLAEDITNAYAFYFDHCFGYYSHEDISKATKGYELFYDIGEEPLEPHFKGVNDTTAQQLWKEPGDTWYFLFDYGDNWLFTITLLKIVDKRPGRTYPILLDTKGEAPEQYPDYEEEVYDDEEEDDEPKLVVH